MDVTFDLSGLEALAARIGRAGGLVTVRAQAAVVSSAEEIVRVAQAHVLVRTGALQSRIGYNLDADGLGATVGPEVSPDGLDGNPVDYGRFVERGTRAHVIDARDGGVLALADGAFTGEVRHPGTSAHPFMGPAVEHAMPRFVAEILAIARAAV